MAGLEKQKVESKFFELDDIIARSESTSCVFDVTNLNSEFFQEMLGIIKPTQTPDGHGADTPLWLLESVRTHYTIHLPQAFSVNMQGVLNADARNVNLSRLQQHFYSNGMQICNLMKEENPDAALNLSRSLLSTLTQRLGEIITSSSNAKKKGDRYDSLEALVFLEGKRCKTDIDIWLKQDNYACSSKKRKRNS